MPLFVLTGATATGKTVLGIELALRHGGEIISADSMQVYRHMDIGTAKPPLEERRGVPHHLIDILDPDQPFSVAEFQRLVLEAARAIVGRGRLPMMVGGTALYIRAVVNEYCFPDAPGDERIRAELGEVANNLGARALHNMLSEVDPVSAARIHENDRRRLIRALEVYRLTGVPLSEFARRRGEGLLDTLVVALDVPRPELYRRIDARVDRMIAAGLPSEVRRLHEMGYGERLFSMQSLGYREMIDFLFGRSTLEEAVRLLKRNTRRFAKRQLTWFRNDPRITWVNVGNNRPKDSVLEEVTRLIEGKLLPA
ncbi:MAG: tRNA (adenosine(37)-N6)-dimethylallyltransferase MiaA [Firmicutes bacterium]|nr:tRNA (adenosine(37)-N6)-dimethylallyltransferase MiaA [Bacillota bacterium]